MHPFRVSVVISTRNRREEVTLCIRSCYEQTVPCEIIVFDDASQDGTSELIRTQFPEVRIITRETPHDSCVNRNEGFRLAQGEFVISLDDDSFFNSPTTIQHIVEAFEKYPQAAILSLAYVEPMDGGERCMSATPEPGTAMRGYVACAAAFRLSSIHQVGGYRDILVHQGEERDLAIRMLDKGEAILFVQTPPIVHLYSPNRDHFRMNYYGFRNTILFSWMRIPFPECLGYAITRTMKLLIYRFTWSSLGLRLYALAAGWWGVVRFAAERGPVRRSTLHTYEQLPSHGPCPITIDERNTLRSTIQSLLPSRRPPPGHAIEERQLAELSQESRVGS